MIDNDQNYTGWVIGDVTTLMPARKHRGRTRLLLEPGALLEEAAEGGEPCAGANHDDGHVQVAGQAEGGASHKAGHLVAGLHGRKPGGAHPLVGPACGSDVIHHRAGHMQALGVGPRARGEGVEAGLQSRGNGAEENACRAEARMATMQWNGPRAKGEGVLSGDNAAKENACREEAHMVPMQCGGLRAKGEGLAIRA